MPDFRTTDRADVARRVLLWLARGLTLVGLATLALVATSVAIGWRTQQLAYEAFAATPRGPVWSPLPSSRAALHRGDTVGALSIPRVDLEAMVLHGSDARTLRRGPGHLEQTALPGPSGNVAIAGHRDSFFRPLRHIRVGDDVYLETGEGRYHYRVSSTAIVRPTDVSVLAPTEQATLTLITCYPFTVVGPAPDRFVVRAELVTPASATPHLSRSR